MNSRLLPVALALLASTSLAQSAQQGTTPAAHKPKASTTAQVSQQHQEEGSRVFQQNCSRCHNAPEGFSPRISGTVVQHMRVRASLSKHDEEVLLRFFNP